MNTKDTTKDNYTMRKSFIELITATKLHKDNTWQHYFWAAFVWLLMIAIVVVVSFAFIIIKTLNNF